MSIRLKRSAAPAEGAAERSPVTPGRKKNRKKWVLLALAVVLILAAGAGIYRLFYAKEERTALTAAATYGSLNETIEGSGTTVPAASVAYDVNGKVLEWCVEPGQEVRAGDLLYRLDPSDVEDRILAYEIDLEGLYGQRADIQQNIANQRISAPFSGRIQDVRVEVGAQAQKGAALATLVDDRVMTATLYFSYIYQELIYNGMPVTLSVTDQMLTLEGVVSDIRYVDYVTPEGMRCFAVSIQVQNPGSLTSGTQVTCWARGSDGGDLYAVSDARLEYLRTATISAQSSGELTAVNVVDYQRVEAGDTIFAIDTSGYEAQLATLQKQIDNLERSITDLQAEIETKYSRYADIDGTVVSAEYSTSWVTGKDTGSVVVYDQGSMKISVNIDELDADALTVGMPVTVYRTTSSSTTFYRGELTYLSLEATSDSNGVSTFAATITITSLEGQRLELPSGVTVYYSIDTGGGRSSGETVLAPIEALCTCSNGYYLLVQADSPPDSAIDPAEMGGSVTDYPAGYYAIPVEVGDYDRQYVQILSGVEPGAVLFLRYQNQAPSGGDITSNIDDESSWSGQFPGGGQMPGFGGGMGGGIGGAGGGAGGGNFGGAGGGGAGGMGGGRTGGR